MADSYFQDATHKTNLDGNEAIGASGDPAGTPTDVYLTPDDLLNHINTAGTNYKISVTVSSNDLVVALKTLAGTDPSTTSPIRFNINGTIRKVTAATSITIADGTNWFGLSPARTATVAPFFTYAVWDSNSSIVALSISTIPYGRVVSDFSTTTTVQNHLYNFTNFTSTDDVINIGYFEATLGVTATFLWTVPTFDGNNLRHVPTFESRWLTWTPAITGYSANPTNTVYRYKVEMYDCLYEMEEATPGTSNATTKTYTAPYTAKTITNMVWGGFITAPHDNGAYGACGFTQIASASNTITMFRSAVAAWTSSGAAGITQTNGRYSIG